LKIRVDTRRDRRISSVYVIRCICLVQFRGFSGAVRIKCGFMEIPGFATKWPKDGKKNWARRDSNSDFSLLRSPPHKGVVSPGPQLRSTPCEVDGSPECYRWPRRECHTIRPRALACIDGNILKSIIHIEYNQCSSRLERT